MFEFDDTRLPACTLDVSTDSDTGRSTYTATAEIVGLDPVRGTTAEERIAGIESLDPPTVVSDNVQDTIDLLFRACLGAYESSGLLTEDTYMTVQTVLGASLRFSLAECFSQAGVDA